MARIKLIVTGDLEKLALHDSLRRLFPSERDGDEVVWDKPRKLHCSTSHRLVRGNKPSVPMLALAQAMLDEVGIGKKGQPADLVVVVDDVELGNLGQEGIIAEHFRAAVNEKLDKFEMSARDRYRSLLRDKCSFHLLCPMTEAYLFGDVDALRVAGVQAGQNPMLTHDDVERFETDDPAWLPTCKQENMSRQKTTAWWVHERHPKHYLEHLTERGGVFYEETDHGKRALIGLLWGGVPKSRADTPVLRALLEDLSDWFHVTNPLGAGDLNAFLYPLRSVNRANLVLRNL
ncbi:uncharacterized protein SOCE26_095440 [Sorangium cellulosum]|uniref:Uncharacterized protein n=1 Tax=Sorangium cellulosum TaxID=56 RepID=A0A2L0F8U3_SORCE|nr:hypothetical protein [Sorangium cellulosum]AUX48018.1 uncharacterized protein SOCE26_095440 [Sorangium cellulosum]